MQHRRNSGVKRAFMATVAFAGAMACAPQSEAPTPRPIVIFTGVRLNASPERMEVVDRWVRAEMTNISEDPTFLISTIFQPEMVYPWDGLELAGDTARVSIQGTAVDARTPFMIYGHLHLMARHGRLDEWLPEAVGLEGYDLERAFMSTPPRTDTSTRSFSPPEPRSFPTKRSGGKRSDPTSARPT